jgi:hypothetical protein
MYQADWTTTLSDDLLAYTATIQTPTITRWPSKEQSPETQEKVVQGVVTYFNSGNKPGNCNLTVTVDSRQQNKVFSLAGGGGDPLG